MLNKWAGGTSALKPLLEQLQSPLGLSRAKNRQAKIVQHVVF